MSFWHKAPLQADSGSSGEARATTSLPWLKLGRGAHLEISPEANNVLKGERGHINLVTVCGYVRTGKSYLLNALLDQQVFGVSDRATSFTQGVEICSRLVPLSEFDTRATSSSPKLAFVDMEGQGDKGIKQDVKVATPLLIISKAVILNELCPHGPAKEVILEKLEVMMYAAQCVGNRKERKGLFGCLHIVLRDCPQNEDECYDILFENEDLLEVDSDDHEKAAKKRNEIRVATKVAFESIKVWCLPKIMATVAPPNYRDADKAYVKKVDEMKLELAKQLAKPKLVQSSTEAVPLTGSLIATLLPELADEIKRDKPALSPPSLMDRVIQAEAELLAEELMKQAKVDVEARVEKRLPMAQEALLQEVGSIRDHLTDGLQGLSGEKACAMFTDKFNGETAKITLQNREQLTKLTAVVGQELEAGASEDLEKLKAELPMAVEKLSAAVERLQGRLHAELALRLQIVPDGEREAVNQRLTGLIAQNQEKLFQNNLNLLIDKEEKDVTSSAKEELEGLELPMQREKLDSCIAKIQGATIAKLKDRLCTVSAPKLDFVMKSVEETIREVEEKVRAQNTEKLSQRARDASAKLETTMQEEADAIVLPQRAESLKQRLDRLRGSIHDLLENLLSIVHPEEAEDVRNRVQTMLQRKEESMFEQNSDSLLRAANRIEEEAVNSFKTRLEALRLPCSEDHLKKKVKDIQEHSLEKLDISIYSNREAEEIQSRIKTQFQAAENELMRRNVQERWRSRWRVIFRSLGLIVFLLLVTWAMDVFKVISLKSISCTVATGTENGLARMWKAQTDVITRLREQLCEGEGVEPEQPPDNDDKEEDDKKRREERRREQDWADEEARRFARGLSRKEVLRWLPFGTGVGIIGVTMCLWSRQ